VEVSRALDSMPPEEVVDVVEELTKERAEGLLDLMEEGKAEEAIERFEEALQLDPGDTRAQYNLGVAYFLQNRHARAADQLRTYLQSVPDDPDACYYLGLALLGIGRPGEAAEALAKAVALHPDDAPAHNAYGIALAQEKEFTRAAREFETARRLQPEISKYRENLACVEHQLSGCRFTP